MHRGTELGRCILAAGVAAVIFAACAAQAAGGKDLTAFVKSIDPEILKPNPVDPNLVISDVDGTSVNKINVEKPDVIFVGNSMLNAGIDIGSFSQQTGLKSMRIISWGSMVPWQFLVMKNVIGSAQSKPKFVVLITRHCIITTPNARASAGYRPTLDKLSGPPEKEQLLHRLAYGKPAIGFPDTSDMSLWDFSKVGEDSFLPYMLRMARDQGYTLVIARHKGRITPTFEQYWSEPARKQYTADLKACVEANGGVFLHYVPFEAIKREHFRDGDHLNGAGMKIWTAKMAEDIKAVMAKAAPAKK